jgi:hypothetical protein
VGDRADERVALTKPDVGSLVLVLGAASLGVIVSRVHHRVVFPTVVKVIEKRVQSRSLVRGTIGWAISLAIGMAVLAFPLLGTAFAGAQGGTELGEAVAASPATEY